MSADERLSCFARPFGPRARRSGPIAVLGPLVLALVLCAPALAQTQEPRLVEVRFEGEVFPFSRAELADLLRLTPDRRFLGLPGVTPQVWIYELGSDSTAIGRALQRAGEPPSRFDATLAEADRERLEAYYRSEGYLEATVSYRTEHLAGDRLRLVYVPVPGPPAQLRRVRYDGLDRLTTDETERLLRATTLRLAPGTEPTEREADAQRLAETDLLDERRRLLDGLRDLGFAAVSRDSIRAVAFPLDTLADGTRRFDLAFQIRPGPRYALGDLSVEVAGPEAAALRIDTLQLGDGIATVRIEGDRRLRPALLRRTLRLEPGELYRQRDLLQAKQRLDRSGVFTFSEIAPQFEAAAVAIGDTLPRLPQRITLRTRPRHALQLEGFLIQRLGVIAPDGTGIGSDEVGIGSGASYRNANLFGAGEQLTVGVNASIASDFSALTSSQIEVTAALSQPYLPGLLRPIERALDPIDSRTRLSVGFVSARREELRLLIRGRASAGLRFELRHSESLTSLLDAFDATLSDPDTLAGFERQFLDLIEDPVARAFVLEDYTAPQVNNAFRYTLRSFTADPFRRDRGRLVEVSAEVGGNLPYLLDRFVVSPGTVEGSLPGLPFFGGDSRLEYRPYARATADARLYRPVSRLTTVAGRLALGVAHPTGQAPVVPFDRRFYAGGATSVRGFELRRLGPGRVPPSAVAFVQGGDIRLESGVEVRQILVRSLFAADWQGVAFADAGNVWFGPRNPGDPDGRFRFTTAPAEIAVGAGFGLRTLWDFLILRLDVAWAVRSPIPGEPLLPDRTPRIHFGIGQAF